MKCQKQQHEQQQTDYQGANCTVSWHLEIGTSVSDVKGTGFVCRIDDVPVPSELLLQKAAVFLCQGNFPELVFPQKKAAKVDHVNEITLWNYTMKLA